MGRRLWLRHCLCHAAAPVMASILSLGLAACVGTVDENRPGGRADVPARGTTGTALPPGPMATALPPGPMATNVAGCPLLPARAYRLTPGQLRRTYAALLGAAAPGEDWQKGLEGAIPDGSGTFSNGEAILSASPGFMETLWNGVRASVATTISNLPGLNACFALGVTRPCVSTMLTEFGARAWRRPWTDEEKNIYLAAYDAAAAKANPKAALEQVLRRLLMAPDVLFRIEAADAPDGNGVSPLTPGETASAIAYALSDGPPDAALLLAAKQGALGTRAGVEAQARRLLERPETAASLLTFFNEYLDGGAQSAHPDQIGELERFVRHVLWTDGGKLSTLLSADYTFVNPTLQKFYGWSKLPVTTDWTLVTPPASEGRSGLLTLGALLGRKTNRSARGKFIQGAFLCTHVPDPPAEAAQTLDGGKASLAVRLGRPPTEEEAREAHTSNPACVSCHKLIDPIGKPLLAFDRQGIWRSTDDSKKPIDTRSEIIATGAIDGSVDGPRALARKLAAAAITADCFSQRAYEFLLGRAASPAELCHLQGPKARLASTGDVRELFTNIVASDAFMLRAVARK